MKWMITPGLGLAAVLIGMQPAWAAAPPAVDPTSIEMPDLTVRPGEGDPDNYDKYFFFHREGTDFATAYADILECDGYARGMNRRTTAPGGGVLADALSDAIFGSAERRKMRRTNMRTCMGFKEYKTYGLPKDVWSRFNFEEGLSPVDDAKRRQFLQAQARVASGPTPLAPEVVE